MDNLTNAFNEELKDLDDYVKPGTYKDRFYKIDGDMKKMLKKNNRVIMVLIKINMIMMLMKLRN